MKKFTFIAMLLAIFSTMAKAQLMDKYFFQVPTDKMASGWVIQDAGNFESTPGKEYLQVYNKKNGGRMLNYFWNEDAWAKTDINSLPNKTYKFTMDLNMSTMYARSDMEFTLLPVNACTKDDQRVASHNQHWWNATEGEDYFFRWRVGEKPAANNGDFTIWINENPTGKTDWTQTTEETLVLSSQKTYKFAVVINANDKTATYTISDEEGNVLKTGVHNYVCAEDRAGIFVFSMNGSSVHQLSNIGLSYEAEGPFANTPSLELIAAMGEQRVYQATFAENETLHWTQLGDASDYAGNSLTDGEEYTVEYGEANEMPDFTTSDEPNGSKLIFCSKSGELKAWTSLVDDPENLSDENVVPVTCEMVTMPTPVASITNVSEGYAKEYTLTADNSNTLLTPVVTIHYTLKDASGNVLKEGDVFTGDKLNVDQKGSLEIYAKDANHPSPWYAESSKVTVNNNAEYVTASKTDYAWSKDVCDKGKEGFSVVEIVDAANKSHWDRIYSTQTYGYDKDGNTDNNYDASKDYAWVKAGHGFYDMGAIGTNDAKWNVLVPENPTTAFAPLAPTEDFVANSKYDASAWNVFPLEGIVYYNTSINNAVLTLDPMYTSDDATKPNFYIVHTRGGYDRPDKGDCNKTTVCVAGESYNLFRYDTALCDVTVMTYKGFVPGTSGISSVNAAETSTSAVKKVVTKDGIRIVKGDKVYSVSGAQLK